ncbi:MAG: hypothetical protein IKZ87_06810 [Actinomycetaceae bacterium]|nr:hypothetical protein [Actinomycetaceae bacterium]
MAPTRKHLPAVRLSRVDKERIESGEIDSEAQALREALTENTGVAGGSERQRNLNARNADEQRLLDELPPHFGKL